MAADGEAALFAAIAARLVEGHAPDMMRADEEALEDLVGTRGYSAMLVKQREGGRSCSLADPLYFDRLERSRTVLLDLAETVQAEEQVAFLMDCLYDAFDLGTGRALAGGEQPISAESSMALH